MYSLVYRKDFGDIEVDIFFDKYDFDYKRSVANAVAAEDVTLDLKEEEEKKDIESVDRPRSGKEARQRRKERIALSARSRNDGDEVLDGSEDEDEEQPVGYEEYER